MDQAQVCIASTTHSRRSNSSQQDKSMVRCSLFHRIGPIVVRLVGAPMRMH